MIGQLLVITGRFPNISVDLNLTFGLETNRFNLSYPLFGIAIFEAILKDKLQTLQKVKDELFVKTGKNRRTVFIDISYLETYRNSMENFLKNLSNVVAHASISLAILKENISFYGTSAIPEHVLGNIETDVNIMKSDIERSKNYLKVLLDRLEDNREQYYKFLVELLHFCAGAVFTVAIPGYLYATNKHSKGRLALLIITCITVAATYFIWIGIVQRQKFWNYNTTNF